jgi:hypothetical protein
MGDLIKPIFFVVLFVGFALTLGYGQMRFATDKEEGTVTVYEGEKKVLTYCFGDQLKNGAAPEQIRSCYIHPLYSLDGQVLTDDFPLDHPHHHGVFWTWPNVETRGEKTQTWHPDTPSLRQYFHRWLEQKVEAEKAFLSVENIWKLNERETVAREILSLCIHAAGQTGRIIDVKLVIEAVEGNLRLQGAQEQDKGYGGLCFRGAPLFKGAVMITDEGLLQKDSTNQPFKWVDLSTKKVGVAVFVSPSHPDYPPSWLIRNSYAGILNVSWPGLEPVVLKPGVPVTLGYRIYIHKGDSKEGEVEKEYQRYIYKISL